MGREENYERALAAIPPGPQRDSLVGYSAVNASEMEREILARAVERMSQELADERIRCNRYSQALHTIVNDGDAEFREGVEPSHTPYTIASRALKP